jgi:hypothetical protein
VVALICPDCSRCAGHAPRYRDFSESMCDEIRVIKR